MGCITLTGPDGRLRAKTFFGVDAGQSGSSDFDNDGSISDLEVSDARLRLEEVLNSQSCGYGGPLGLGGWGGINEACLQPWNMGGPARDQTPDGYALKAKLKLDEDHWKKEFLFFHSREQTVKEVEVTIRWENGKIRLYQGQLPPYQTPPPPPPAPDWIPEIKKAGTYMVAGVTYFFKDVPSYTASIFWGVSTLWSESVSFLDSLGSSGPRLVAESKQP